MRITPVLTAFLLLGSAVQAAVFTASLSGAAEDTPNASPATGATTVTYDPVAHMLTVEFTFSGLSGLSSAAHIHAPTLAPLTGTAGVATQVPYFVGFPVGVKSGSYLNTFDLAEAASWNPAFITSNGGTPATAEAALAGALMSGRAYLNIHTSPDPTTGVGYGSGEIRGFLEVPEPATYALIAGLGLCGFGVWRRLTRI